MSDVKITEVLPQVAATDAPKIVLRDAKVCIACAVVHDLPKGKGIQSFYCKRCEDAFRDNMKQWKKFGITVVKRGAVS